MSSFEFFPEERPGTVGGVDEVLAPGDVDAPAFRGIGHELYAAPARGVLSVGAALGLAAGAVNAPIDALLGTDLQDQAFGYVDRARAARRALTLHPSEVGIAARILGGVGEFVTELALTRAPGAIATGELNTAADLAAEGIDPQTAVQAGALEAAGTAVGFRIPGLGRSLLQRVAFGVGANLAQGVTVRGAVGELLQSQGAPSAVSGQWDAWNAEALAVDAITGAVFGGVEHWAQRDAAAAVNDHAHRVAGTAPGEPITADALDVNSRLIDLAIEQSLADQPVTAEAPPGRFADDGTRAAQQARTELEVDTLRPAAAPVDESQIFNPITPNAAPTKKVAQLRALTRENKPIVDAFLEELDAALGTESKSNVKKDATIIAKANRPEVLAAKPWFRIEHIRDSFRFKTILEDVRALPEIVDRLGALGARVVKPDVDKVLAPKPWGFRISVFDLRMPNGQLVEYYLPVREIEAFKNGRGHQLFENWRDAKLSDLSEADRVRYEADRAESAAGYQAAWDAYLSRTGATEAEIRASLDSALERSRSLISSKASSNSADVKAGAPVVQAPAGERVAQKPESITTMVPSGDLKAGIVAASDESITEAPAALQGADGAALPKYTLAPSTPENEGLSGWRTRPGSSGFVYTIRDGARSVGFLDVSIFPDGTAFIEDVVSDRGPGSIGLSGTRALLRALLAEHPEITNINGERVSGIRRGGKHGSAGSGVMVSVKVPAREGAEQAGDSTPAPDTLQGADGAAAVVVTERGLEVPVRYRLVDAAALVTSHGDTLEPNPDFPPELQPRDRSRAASEAQIARIENQIRPELLGESVKASDGAPIVGADGVVESGNARTIALRRAYAGGKAENYRAWVRDNAARFGLDPATVDGMQAPVLVRVAQGARDRAEFARQANESAIATMSPGELASADAQRLGSLEGLATNEDGSINLSQSRPVVEAFLRDVVSPADLNTTTTAEGGLSQGGLARLRNAIFARAYGDTELLQSLTEAIDSNVKNVLAGMVRAAPEVARLRDLQAEGARHAIPVFDDFAEAVREFQAMRTAGMTMAQREAQAGLFGDSLPAPVRNLIVGLEENSRAPRRMAELISHMARTVDAAGDPRQGGLFGDTLTLPDAAEVSNQAVARIRREYDVKVTADLFASPTLQAAVELAATRPDMMVVNADGLEVPAAQALAEADAMIKQAEELAPGVDALAACALQQLATVAA